MRYAKWILLGLVVLLSACHAYEMRLKDPLFDFKSLGTKRILLLPLDTDPQFPTPEAFQQQTFEQLQATFKEMPSVEIVPWENDPEIFKPEARLWDLSPATLKALGDKTKADIVVTGKIRYFERAGVRQDSSAAIPGMGTQAQSSIKNLLMEMQLATQYWDAQEGKLLFFSHQTVRDISLLASRAELEQKLLRLAVRRITDPIKPYYVYE